MLEGNRYQNITLSLAEVGRRQPLNAASPMRSIRGGKGGRRGRWVSVPRCLLRVVRELSFFVPLGLPLSFVFPALLLSCLSRGFVLSSSRLSSLELACFLCRALLFVSFSCGSLAVCVCASVVRWLSLPASLLSVAHNFEAVCKGRIGDRCQPRRVRLVLVVLVVLQYCSVVG